MYKIVPEHRPAGPTRQSRMIAIAAAHESRLEYIRRDLEENAGTGLQVLRT